MTVGFVALDYAPIFDCEYAPDNGDKDGVRMLHMLMLMRIMKLACQLILTYNPIMILTKSLANARSFLVFLPAYGMFHMQFS